LVVYPAFVAVVMAAGAAADCAMCFVLVHFGFSLVWVGRLGLGL